VQLKKIQCLLEATHRLDCKPKDDPALPVSGAEFILEGLCALKKIGRNEELGYYAKRQSSETLEEESMCVFEHRCVQS
jgi:hypothetical protein